MKASDSNNSIEISGDVEAIKVAEGCSIIVGGWECSISDSTRKGIDLSNIDTEFHKDNFVEHDGLGGKWSNSDGKVGGRGSDNIKEDA